jgi:hypothetical protein
LDKFLPTSLKTESSVGSKAPEGVCHDDLRTGSSVASHRNGCRSRRHYRRESCTHGVCQGRIHPSREPAGFRWCWHAGSPDDRRHERHAWHRDVRSRERSRVLRENADARDVCDSSGDELEQLVETRRADGRWGQTRWHVSRRSRQEHLHPTVHSHRSDEGHPRHHPQSSLIADGRIRGLWFALSVDHNPLLNLGIFYNNLSKC